MRNKSLLQFILLTSLLSGATLAMAHENHSKHIKLSDGSTVTESRSTDGNRIRQIHQADGRIETTTTNPEGNQNIVTQYPDGRMGMQSRSGS